MYVGNLPFSTTSNELEALFSKVGTVTSAQVITDRETGRSRGFGFVEMSTGSEQAIKNLNGAQLQGRTMVVNEARPREERSSGRDGGRSRGGYGGGGRW